MLSPGIDSPTDPHRHTVVVLAEDDEVLRRSLGDFLASEGFMVREVSDVHTLEKELDSEDALAIVVDLHLEDGDTEHIVAELAEREQRPHVVLMSASASAAKVAREHGVQLLAKPFDLETLVQALLVPID